MLKYEPVVITTAIAAIISLLIAFGVNITEQQNTAIMRFVEAILPIIPFAIGAIVAWANAWSKDSVEKVTGTNIKNAENILKSKKRGRQ